MMISKTSSNDIKDAPIKSDNAPPNLFNSSTRVGYSGLSTITSTSNDS